MGCYPVFTEPETSSIGIDELQCLLLKNVLMMGVDFRFGVGYENASIIVDGKSQKPSWKVKLTYDDHAQKIFGKPAASEEVFDCLIGCMDPGVQSGTRSKNCLATLKNGSSWIVLVLSEMCRNFPGND